ncbi:hypothetical protein [Nocardia rhizosphaerihabitans]|uniref:hypothetical protein n=1 Tax=Nocardia rhizosphaerihabitans TaxID=1691570 RepID=UPI001664EFB4|nr:hypothetical protein [Nocardia rhizosphaerihabitans]
MPDTSEIARLFDRRPRHWGAPGDSVAWDVLRDRICAVPAPETATEFATLLRQEFTLLVGADTDNDATEREFVADGRSETVHLPTWRTILLPLLTTRARQLYGELPTERP